MFYNDIFQTCKWLSILITLDKPFQSQQFVHFISNLKHDNLFFKQIYPVSGLVAFVSSSQIFIMANICQVINMSY